MSERILRNQRRLYATATLAGVIHAVDEVFFAEEAYRAIPVAILSVLVAIFYERVPDIWRGVSGLAFGAFWLGGIVTHWIPASQDGPTAGDYTSLISVPGSILFLIVGVTILRARSSAQVAEAR